MPTAGDISGPDPAPRARGAAARTRMVPTDPASARFGTTMDLKGRPGRQRSVVGAVIVTLLAVSVGGMIYTLRVRREMERAGAIAAAAAQAAAADAVAAQAPPGGPR
jgi:hypothetical protein